MPVDEMFISFLERIGWKRVWDKIYAVLIMSSRPLTMKELAKRTGYSLSSLSTNLRVLLRLRVVTRVKRRGVYVYCAVRRMVEVYREHIRLIVETEVIPLQERIREALKTETDKKIKRDLMRMFDEMTMLREYLEFQLREYPVRARGSRS
jgi:DNA-binding transcriptional regulator GbsR (MarR family)